MQTRSSIFSTRGERVLEETDRSRSREALRPREGDLFRESLVSRDRDRDLSLPPRLHFVPFVLLDFALPPFLHFHLFANNFAIEANLDSGFISDWNPKSTNPIKKLAAIKNDSFGSPLQQIGLSYSSW